MHMNRHEMPECTFKVVFPLISVRGVKGILMTASSIPCLSQTDMPENRRGQHEDMGPGRAPFISKLTFFMNLFVKALQTKSDSSPQRCFATSNGLAIAEVFLHKTMFLLICGP